MSQRFFFVSHNSKHFTYPVVRAILRSWRAAVPVKPMKDEHKQLVYKYLQCEMDITGGYVSRSCLWLLGEDRLIIRAVTFENTSISVYLKSKESVLGDPVMHIITKSTHTRSS